MKINIQINTGDYCAHMKSKNLILLHLLLLILVLQKPQHFVQINLHCCWFSFDRAFGKARKESRKLKTVRLAFRFCTRVTSFYLGSSHIPFQDTVLKTNTKKGKAANPCSSIMCVRACGRTFPMASVWCCVQICSLLTQCCRSLASVAGEKRHMKA